MLAIGQVVYAKNGRDAGGVFVISAAEGEYVWLVDGKRRTLDRPKKKKNKHVQLTHTHLPDIAQKLIAQSPVPNDADIRKALKPYRKDSEA